MSAVKSETVKGTIDNVVYYSEETDYAVIELVSDELLITAVGSMPIPAEGEVVTLTGKWSYHKEFGKQFAFDSFEKCLPSDDEGMLRYLSSRAVKGVGPATAKKIIDKFGKDSFDVIEHHPEWLADINGITMKKAAEISKSFIEQTGLMGVVMFCRDYISVSDSARVYKRLGAGAVGLLSENPYILCNSDYGIPFTSADKLAMSMSFPQDSEKRIRAGIRFVFNNAAAVKGHTALPRGELISEAARLLSVDIECIESFISRFISEGMLATYTKGEEELLLLKEMAAAESYIAKRLMAINAGAENIGVSNIDALIAKIEATGGIEYAKQQKRAIYEALLGGVLILTGGPGTGKTTVVKALLSIFKSLGMKTALAAPTGRAAKRMSEATSEYATTLHRLLEMDRSLDYSVRFGKDETNPISQNVVIVDEASMIDTYLLEALLHALRRGTRLILIGDSNQLPSVGAGNVLADLIDSGTIKTVTLTEIFRQSEKSLIVTNAHRINRGELPYLGATKGDFFFVRRDNERDIAETIASLITERLPRTYGEHITGSLQVITPSKKGEGGVELLNATLQERLNPRDKRKAEKSSHGVTFRTGDRVMQTVNNYELEWERDNETGQGIFNGDIGVIESIDTKSLSMKISFDDRVVSYPFDSLDELELAYAITVHKSQGSEYSAVIIPMYRCAPMLMTRNLLYTAVTRAKSLVIMVGNASVVDAMVKNNREIKRYTTLKERLVGGGD